MPSNLLRNLTQSGALNVYNPMESYQGALAAKTMQSNLLSGEMNQEAKALTLFKSYVNQAETAEDYGKVRQYAINNLGMNPELMPEFDSDEEFIAARPRMASGIEETIKAKQGKQFTIHKKKTGSELKVTTEKYNELVENKMINPDEWDMGSVSDVTEPDYQTFYDIKGVAHTIDVTKIAPDKTWSEDKPAEKPVEKDPTTAWQGFFKNNPDATEDEIIAFKRKLDKPGKGAGELTDVKLDKLVKDLKTLRLRIETTKGIDPALFMLFGESSAALDAYKKGDTTQALTEIDAQIEKYEGIREKRTGGTPKKLKLPKGLTEETIEFNKKKYNKTRPEIIEQYIKLNK